MGAASISGEQDHSLEPSYYPVYSFDPACTYNDKVSQQGAMIHEGIHYILASMPGCKNPCWFQEGSAYKYKLSRVDATGKFLESPIDVTAKAKWGRRDDPFRAHGNGDVVWTWFDTAASTTLHFARLRSGGTATCAGF